MRVTDKVVVVTGGGSGIGAALCERFAQEGARGIGVLDLNETAAHNVAAPLGAHAIGCDVTIEANLRAAVEGVEARFGPIDLFCSNAGVLCNDPNFPDPASASDAAWALSLGIHLMSHVYAARLLGPRMAARGGGYFLNTVSAAGLLTQIGSGPYSASKHAAIGFAEHLAIAYRDRGIGVSVLCPQGVSTPMVAGAANTPAVSDGLLTPQDVAASVVKGLAEERFLILPHPQVTEYARRKAVDYDRWLSGMAKLRRRSANL